MTENHPSGERILASQTAIVTGSRSGIGAGIAGELGRPAPAMVNYAGNREGTDAVVREITEAARWLASDESDYIHGATLLVDGRMTLYPCFSVRG